MRPGKIYIDELRQRKKRRRKRIAFLVIFVILGVAAGSIYALFFSGWFTIKGIEISGNQELNREEIKNLAGSHIEKSYLFGLIKPYSNILFTNSENIKHSLENNYPLIESVSVNKKLFSKNLEVEIKERESVAVYCKKDLSAQAGAEICFYFDRNNVFFKDAPRFSGQLFLVIEDSRNRDFKLGHSFDDAELLEKIFETKRVLDELKIIEYQNFVLPENSFDFWIKAKEGWNVYLDKETDISSQLVALKKFLDEKLPPDRRQTLQYIDIRINNRIYYK